MGNDDKTPSPQEALKAGIKAVVGAANGALQSLEQVTEGARGPMANAFATAKTQSAFVAEKATYTYKRRHEFAPELIGGSAVLGGGLMALRRGRIAGLLGAGIAGGAAYAVVYDEISMAGIPDLVFGKKD